MSRTITAMFDTRADAEAGKARLEAAGIDAAHVNVHDDSTHQTSGAQSTHTDQGTWASIKHAFLPDEDRHTYEEGFRRGHAVLTADVADEHADDAVRALEEANSVDVDQQAAGWRESGWDYQGGQTGQSAGLFGASGATDAGLATGSARQGSTEEVIPVVEEQLVVGKREVDRGGVRVRSYVSETPVHEQVRLREERVDVQRRPVDRAVDTLSGDAFQERTIDMTATSEEAVVGKTARVVEEVVVSKTAGERTEEIDDTVRKTEVEIDRDGTDTRGGTTGFGTSSKR
ncbi:YsnF/AvaK domain-containing protein [Sphingomonas bacterium]|uniref:YsnF/AvaK domain-containing protein n=1 Tax=Sphingomonas bacterium TaxID=1895847 RepID=UPI001576F8E7|nr:YsnF/AvaK domain-containing protein [Sphingomonas bacterium]